MKIELRHDEIREIVAAEIAKRFGSTSNDVDLEITARVRDEMYSDKDGTPLGKWFELIAYIGFSRRE